jgi:peptide deformylase
MNKPMSVLIPETDTTGVLRKQAEKVTNFDNGLLDQVGRLHATLDEIRQQLGFGRALAAPQAGISKRIIVMNLGAGPITLINPEITWRSDEMQDVWDDCLSTPDVLVKISRHLSISIHYQDVSGKVHHWHQLSADISELLQHEYEHLAGTLMIDYATADNVLPSSQRNTLPSAEKSSRISLTRIKQAHEHINPTFINSPLVQSDSLSQRINTNVWLKDETQNPIGCFKARGAENYLAILAKAAAKKPIVCASAGNWGLALAWSCHQRNYPLYVFVPVNANAVKVDKIQSLGATIIKSGKDFDDAKQQAKVFSQEQDYLFVEDGKEVSVSEGAGTIGIELLDAKRDLDAVYIPLGNGALISGIACWIKAASPGTKIIGVVPQGADSMYHSWKSSSPVIRNAVNTIADGLAVRIPVPEAVEDIKGIVDDVILVDDEMILQAMQMMEAHDSLILEPSGAAGIAGLLASHHQSSSDENVAVILTGANRA